MTTPIIIFTKENQCWNKCPSKGIEKLILCMSKPNYISNTIFFFDLAVFWYCICHLISGKQYETQMYQHQSPPVIYSWFCKWSVSRKGLYCLIAMSTLVFRSPENSKEHCISKAVCPKFSVLNSKFHQKASHELM